MNAEDADPFKTRFVDETLAFCRSTTDGDISTKRSVSQTAESVFTAGRSLENRYLLQSLLGSGGMGRVFLADDRRLSRRVAIKVIGQSRNLSTAEKQLRREARLAASLQHPNIAAVYDFGFVQDHSYTVFEYVDGQSLREVIRTRTRIPLAEVRPIIGQLARALDHAHSKSIIHRDLKPENVCLTATGLSKLLDLGLAHELTQNQDSSLYSGTPSYSSPEQASCQPIDGRCDQYSLGLLCYEMLTGTRPFKASNPADMLLNQIRTPPPDPREFLANLDPPVAEAILRALSKHPNERFATCQEFALAIGDATVSASNPVVAISSDKRYCFYVCHAPEDSIVAGQLGAGLEQRGFSCWLYQRDALPGVSLQQQVRSVMNRCHGILVLISHAFTRYPALIEELGYAHHLGRIFFPLLIEMSQEELDAQQLAWRSMLGPSVPMPIHATDDMVQRLVSGAEQVGIERSMAKKPPPPAQGGFLAGRIWATDANQIDIADLDRVVFRTEMIEDFLQRRHKTFLSATKGLGKTLLLTYKRHQLMQQVSTKGITTIPEGRPYLDFMTDLRSLSEKYQKPLSDLNTTKRLWNMAIRVATISHHHHLIDAEEEGFELKAFPQRIRRWLAGTKIQPTVVFKELTSLRVSELNRLVDETEVFLDQKMRCVHSGTCIFVDKVDQAVRQLPRQAWINVQAGLIEAAWETMNANSHVSVFATIREEAFASYESDVKSNLFGAITRLRYSESELAAMLDQLTACYEGCRGFKDFIGLNVIRHAKRPAPEDSYRFIRRHTLGRPRDLVAMASEISARRSSLSEDRFRTTVYETSATSLVSNIFDEVQVFLSCLNDRETRQRFMASLPHNILSRQDAIEACERFNGLEQGTIQTLGEESTYIHHPFRDLYLAGLLGVVERSLDAGDQQQRFRQPHDILQDIDFELPDSEFYLIHPALNNYISQHRSYRPYLVFQQIIVGHDQGWQSYYGLFCEVEKQLANLGIEASTVGHRLLRQSHASLKANRDQLRSLYSTHSSDWQTLLHGSPATDELVYWFGELASLATS